MKVYAKDGSEVFVSPAQLQDVLDAGFTKNPPKKAKSEDELDENAGGNADGENADGENADGGKDELDESASGNADGGKDELVKKPRVAKIKPVVIEK